MLYGKTYKNHVEGYFFSTPYETVCSNLMWKCPSQVYIWYCNDWWSRWCIIHMCLMHILFQPAFWTKSDMCNFFPLNIIPLNVTAWNNINSRVSKQYIFINHILVFLLWISNGKICLQMKIFTHFHFTLMDRTFRNKIVPYVRHPYFLIQAPTSYWIVLCYRASQSQSLYIHNTSELHGLAEL